MAASVDKVLWKDWKTARNQLREWRNENYRRSRYVVDLGQRLLKDHSSKLGDEVWDVKEQVCIAALDCGNGDLAQSILAQLMKAFPVSVRRVKLEGMFLESQGMFDEALSMYDEFLEKDGSCAAIWKRKVAIFKAKGVPEEAVKELNKYLEVFICDYEAWLEQSELYISMQCFEEAAYCLEEVLLANPHNYLHHQRYAEICYTQGGSEWYALACKHYARSIKLNPRNIRALYGYHLAQCACASSSKGSSAKLYKEKKETIDWTASQIKKIYSECCSKESLCLVEEGLESLEKSCQLTS